MTIRFRIRSTATLLLGALAASGLACGAVIGIEDGHPKPRASEGGAGGAAGAIASGGVGPGTSGAAGTRAGGSGGAATNASGSGGTGGVASGSGAGGSAGSAGVAGAAGTTTFGGHAGSNQNAGHGGDAGHGGNAGASFPGYGIPPTGVKVRTLASSADDPVAALATTAASDLVVVGQLGGAMPVGAPTDLLPAPTGTTAYVLRYDPADTLTLAARVHAPSLTLRRVVTGADGAIYVLGRAEGPLSVLDVPLIDPGSSPTAASTGAFLLRFEASGALAWVRRFDASPGQTLALESVVTSGDALVVAGSFDGTVSAPTTAGVTTLTSAPGAETDVLIARLVATTGEIARLAHLGSSGADDHVALVGTEDGARLAFTCAGAFVAPANNALPSCQGIATVAIDAALALGSATSFTVSSPDQIVFARAHGDGFLLGARYAGAATLPPLPPLPTGPDRFLVARLDEQGSPTRARTLPETGIVALEVVTADFDGGVLLGGSGRGCLPGDTGGQVCTAPANTRNALVLRLDATLGLEWASFQTAQSGAPAGIVKSVVLCPNGDLLGASSFDTSVQVLKQKVPWKGGTDGVVGRFFHQLFSGSEAIEDVGRWDDVPGWARRDGDGDDGREPGGADGVRRPPAPGRSGRRRGPARRGHPRGGLGGWRQTGLRRRDGRHRAGARRRPQRRRGCPRRRIPGADRGEHAHAGHSETQRGERRSGLPRSFAARG